MWLITAWGTKKHLALIIMITRKHLALINMRNRKHLNLISMMTRSTWSFSKRTRKHLTLISMTTWKHLALISRRTESTCPLLAWELGSIWPLLAWLIENWKHLAFISERTRERLNLFLNGDDEAPGPGSTRPGRLPAWGPESTCNSYKWGQCITLSRKLKCAWVPWWISKWGKWRTSTRKHLLCLPGTRYNLVLSVLLLGPHSATAPGGKTVAKPK
jgi:hypothetical protein